MIQNEKDAFFAQYAPNTDNAVLEIIWQAKETRATRLDLGNCGLTELPDALFELTWLEELILSDIWEEYSYEKKEWENLKSRNEGKKNNVKFLHPKVKLLSSLKTLIVSGNHHVDVRIMGYGDETTKWDLIDLCPLKGLPNLQYLSFSYTQVIDLSPLKDLSALRQLNVSNTELKDLSPLKDLLDLQYLDISNTQVKDLSPLKDLTALQELSVNSTQISDLSPLKNLTALEALYISQTLVSDLSALKALSDLKFLTIFDTAVNNLSPLKDLTALQKLSGSKTQVSDLSPLKGLTALQELSIFNTNVSDLSPLKNLSALQHLDIQFTKTSDLSPLKDLMALKELLVQKCAIQYIPKEIYDQWECANDLYAYWQDLTQSQTAINNQLKIMFLGNGCVGKTTLLHWFLDNEFKDLSLEDGRTHGIIIQPYTFKDSDVLAHFWDFGGQEVYHATHRLFLGRRSLYLLVWATESPDAAHEERHPPQYWLDMIADIGGHERSRVLIVQNLFDGQTERNILTDTERQDYEKRGLDITTYCVNAKTGLKIKSLKTAIEEEAEQLLKTNIEELPTSWVNIRKAVADKRLAKDKILAWAAFENICRDCGLTTDPNVILGYLHRAGELFHYDNQFDNQIILDQEWALKAVYAVLKGDRIERYKGVFTLHDLKDFWQKDNPNLTDNEAIIFLNFMLANNTMFYTEGSYKERGDNPEFVVPQLLPIEKPEMYSLWEEIPNKIRYQIEYTFLHRDIIERFIVATAHLSKKKSYWRNGLFIDYQNGKALVEVVLIDEKKRIQIECTGTTQTELLQTIREEFNKIRTLDKAKEYRFTNGDWVQVKGEITRLAENMGGFKEKELTFEYPKKDNISSQLTTENSMKQYLLDLIAEGKLKEALDLMRQISNTQSSYFNDPIIGLLSRYNRNEREKGSTISTEDYRMEYNRIENSTKSLLSSEFDESKAPAPPKVELKEENKQSDKQTSNSERDNKETTSGKLKILMMTANPSTQTELDLDAEHSSIVQKLQNKQEQFSFKIYKGVSKSGFKEITETNKPDILHFSGHGQNGKYGGLIVQKTDGSEDLIPPKGLSAVFKYFKSEDIFIKATILNACYSEEQALAICNHVPYVIGTTLNIGDKLAIAFSIGFYFKLAETGSIEKAFLSGVAQASMDGADESDFVIYKDGSKLEI